MMDSMNMLMMVIIISHGDDDGHGDYEDDGHGDDVHDADDHDGGDDDDGDGDDHGHGVSHEARMHFCPPCPINSATAGYLKTQQTRPRLRERKPQTSATAETTCNRGNNPQLRINAGPRNAGTPG